MKPKCILVLEKIQVLCQKSPVESRYPELMYKRYCLYLPRYLVQHHLCFVEGVSLPLEARKEFLAERNLLRFHYTYWTPSILLRSKHYVSSFWDWKSFQSCLRTLIEKMWPTSYTLLRDGFELEFSGSSKPELWRFRAEPSRAGALQFPSWNRADNIDNMYVKK